MNPEPCELCGVVASVGPVYGPDGAPRATVLTDCPTCGGQWTISIADVPLLKKENAQTKRRIAAKVHEQAKMDPETPLPVDDGLILYLRH